MGGSPFNSAKLGASKLIDACLVDEISERPFERIKTLFYDT